MIFQALLKIDAIQEACADREQTILKFRELVSTLQEQNEDLRDKVQTETAKPVQTPADLMDFKVSNGLYFFLGSFLCDVCFVSLWQTLGEDQFLVKTYIFAN